MKFPELSLTARSTGEDAEFKNSIATKSSAQWGYTTLFNPVPSAVTLMTEWFERVGYSADIPAQERRFGIHALTLVEWVRTLPRG